MPFRIVLNNQGEEGGEDEGETAGAEDVYEVRIDHRGQG